MKETLRKFIKTSGIFFLGAVLSKALVFFLLPLYTRLIPAESFGYYDVSVAYITVFTSLLYLDIWATVLRFLYDADRPEQRRQVASTCWMIFGFSSLFYLLAGAALCRAFSVRYAGWILLYGLSMNLHNMSGFVARGLRKNVAFAVSGILNTGVLMAGNLVLILGLGMGIEALYLSAILGNGCQTVFLMAKAGAAPRFRAFVPDKALLRTILRFSLPLCVNSVTYWLLTSYNRIALEQIGGLHLNGIYAIGNKFGVALSLVTTCFTYAWQDIAFTRAKSRGKDGAFYGGACTMYLGFLAAGIALLLPCFQLLFPVLIGPGYQEAFPTLPLFLVMVMLSAFSVFISNIFYALKDSRTILCSMLIACAANLLLCRPLIRAWGINGANLSICLSFLLNILICGVVLARRIGFRLDGRVVFLSAAGISLASLVYLSAEAALNALLLLLLAAALGGFLWRKRKELAYG